MHNCLFLSCKSLTAESDWDGGGALCSYTTGLITITQSSFIHCSAGGQRGGAIHIRYGADVSISEALFIDCSCSAYGGGLLTEYGPSLTLSNSKFILCRTQFGGACGFHARKPIFSVSNCIFARNHASGSTRGGGAVEDNVDETRHHCMYSFSFFTENTACNGNDIAANNVGYSSSPFIHCFTTTAINGFSNAGNTETNWFPLGILFRTFDRMTDANTDLFTKHNNKTVINQQYTKLHKSILY